MITSAIRKSFTFSQKASSDLRERVAEVAPVEEVALSLGQPGES